MSTEYEAILMTAFSAPTKPVGGIWCSECEHCEEIIDPNECGDFTATANECGLPFSTPCPYGKLEPDGE